MNSKVMKLEGFSYDGRGGDVYFWVGVGPQPSSKGHKVNIYTHNDFFKKMKHFDRNLFDKELRKKGQS